jgi:hypothetical protein
MISPQSIRKGITIKFDNVEVDKATIINSSKEWKENHEILFKKLLKQGGSFKINGILVEVKPTDKMLTSRGEQDTGILKVDPFARF